MTCPSCNMPVPEGTKFCPHCRAELAAFAGTPVSKCLKCGAELMPNWKICPECGTPVGPSRCKNCGAELKPNWKICPECGTPVDSARPVQDEGPDDKEIDRVIDQAGDTFNSGGDSGKNRAIKLLTEKLLVFKDNPRLLATRGEMYSIMGNYDYAISDLSDAIKLEPEEKVYRYERGKAFSGDENHSAAIEDFTKAIQIDPEYADAFRERGIAYYGSGENNRAAKDVAKAIQLNPDDVGACVFRGLMFIDEENYGSALQNFNRAIKLKGGKDAFLYNCRGIAYRGLGNIEKAVEDFEEAVRLDPDNEEYGKNLESLVDDEDGGLSYDEERGVLTGACPNCGRNVEFIKAGDSLTKSFAKGVSRALKGAFTLLNNPVEAAAEVAALDFGRSLSVGHKKIPVFACPLCGEKLVFCKNCDTLVGFREISDGLAICENCGAECGATGV